MISTLDLVDVKSVKFFVIFYNTHDHLVIVHPLQQADIALVLRVIRKILLMSLNVIAATRLLLFLLTYKRAALVAEVLEFFAQHLLVDLGQVAEVLLVFLLHILKVSQTD